MKQAAIFGPDDVRLMEAPEPEIGPRDVIIDVAACGICGSDISYARLGGIGLARPMPIGHEFSGIIAQVGPEVRDFGPGDRVIVNPVVPPNLIGNGGAVGAFAPHVLVREASRRMIFPIPDDMPFDRAAAVEPFAVALHAIKRARLSGQERIAVFGAGPIGLALTALLRLRGHRDLVSVDLSDGRLARARAMGADATFNPARDAVRDGLAAIHGAGSIYEMPFVGTDVFFEAAGAKGLVPELVDMAAPESRLVLVAVNFQPEPMSFVNFMTKEMTLLSSMAYEDEFPEIIDILSSGAIDLDPFISHRFEFSAFDAAFATARDKENSAKVMVTFGTEATR